MAKIFDSSEYAKWKSFRQSEDSRYVGLCLPHVLSRLPYGKDGVQVDAFNYEEGVDGTDHSKYLWGNAAYALGARLTGAGLTSPVDINLSASGVTTTVDALAARAGQFMREVFCVV